MIKQSVRDAINQQITKEMYSSNLYLAMASYFHTVNLNGFANWMRIQAQEEMMHAIKFFDYLINRGGEVKLGQIAAPPQQWDSPLSAFEAAYEHEQLVTASINEMAGLSLQESDHATNVFLHWFITEQVEEEATVSEIVDRLRLAGDSKSSLFILDNELKQRTLPAGQE